MELSEPMRCVGTVMNNQIFVLLQFFLLSSIMGRHVLGRLVHGVSCPFDEMSMGRNVHVRVDHERVVRGASSHGRVVMGRVAMGRIVR